MNPFKAGQQVRCITDSRMFVTKGQTYIVVRTNGRERVVVMDNDGDEGTYLTSVFEAVVVPEPERSHGIKVGSKVLVLNGDGDIHFRPFVNTVQTVAEVHNNRWDDKEDMIACVGIDGSQFAQRFQLITDSALIGYDKEGNVSFMSVDKLKPMQRVVLQNGDQAIVVRGDEDSLHLVFEGDCWNPAHFDFTDDDGDYNIVEVYETTGLKAGSFNFGLRGALIWKKVDVVKEAAKKEADTALAAAKEALAKAEAARAALN